MFFLKYVISSKDPITTDRISGILNSLSFVRGVEEQSNSIEVYVDELDAANLERALAEWGYGFSRTEKIKNQNWNQQWENNFDPVEIGQFCIIRAPFHRSFARSKMEIIIAPKMAFGTGHHETTYMMIEQLSSEKIVGKEVIDLGAGSGILSIFCEKSGATVIDAVEIQPEAFENISENMTLNGCSVIRPVLGSIETVQDHQYDLVLANINRNVLISLAQNIIGFLKNDATLLLSGILKSDQQQLVDEYGDLGIDLVLVRQKGEWILMRGHRWPNNSLKSK